MSRYKALLSVLKLVIQWFKFRHFVIQRGFPMVLIVNVQIGRRIVYTTSIFALSVAMKDKSQVVGRSIQSQKSRQMTLVVETPDKKNRVVLIKSCCCNKSHVLFLRM